MRKILASTLAAMVALSAFAGAAEAKQWKKYHHYKGPPPHARYYPGPYYRPYYYDPGPAIAAGVIFGTLGAMALSNNYGYGGPRSHTAWCEWRYKTYNPATDQFYAKPGVLAYCHAPYDY